MVPLNMSWSLRLLFLLTLYIKVRSHPLVTDNSTIEWKSNLGTQYPGITPLFAKLGDKVAIGSILKNEKMFQLDLRTLTILGEQKMLCSIPLVSRMDKIWELRMISLSESIVIVSFLYNDQTINEGGIRIITIDTSDCQYSFDEDVIYTNVHYIYFTPYAIVPYKNNDYNVFIKSPICGEGICKINLNARAEGIDQNAISSFTKDDDALSWTIIPVDPNSPSSGFYYISTPNTEEHPGSKTSLSLFTSNSTLLKSIQLDSKAEDSTCHSNAHAHLGYCYVAEKSVNVSCLLLDSDLKEKLRVSVPVCRDPENCWIKKISMLNAPDGAGFALHAMACLTRHCELHETLAFDVEADGELSEPLQFQSSEARCFPRNDFGIFEVDGELRCDGAPCLRKQSVEDKVYEVSVSAKCIKRSV